MQWTGWAEDDEYSRSEASVDTYTMCAVCMYASCLNNRIIRIVFGNLLLILLAIQIQLLDDYNYDLNTLLKFEQNNSIYKFYLVECKCTQGLFSHILYWYWIDVLLLLHIFRVSCVNCVSHVRSTTNANRTAQLQWSNCIAQPWAELSCWEVPSSIHPWF